MSKGKLNPTKEEVEEVKNNSKNGTITLHKIGSSLVVEIVSLEGSAADIMLPKENIPEMIEALSVILSKIEEKEEETEESEEEIAQVEEE